MQKYCPPTFNSTIPFNSLEFLEEEWGREEVIEVILSQSSSVEMVSSEVLIIMKEKWIYLRIYVVGKLSDIRLNSFQFEKMMMLT